MNADKIQLGKQIIKRFEEMKAKRLELDCCNPMPVQETDGPTMYDILHGRCKPEKPTTRNDDMYVSQDVNVTEKTSEDARRNYFLDRAAATWPKKYNAERDFFHMDDDPTPKTPQELIDRIQSGKFQFKNVDKKDQEEYDPIQKIVWRDPAQKKDPVGFEAAHTKLNAILAATLDAIWAETDASKLPSLITALETTTVH
jgi:hypothetical protein